MNLVKSFRTAETADPLGAEAILVSADCALDEPFSIFPEPMLREIAAGTVLRVIFVDYLAPVVLWPAPDRSFLRSLEEPVADFATVVPLMAVRVLDSEGEIAHLCLWTEMRPRNPDQLSEWALRCECRDDQCLYSQAARLLRTAVKRTVADKDPSVLRDLLERDRTGEWLGQPGGFPMWGSTMYLQTVSLLTGWTMHECWAVADQAVKAGVISMEGAVLGYPIARRDAPAGPIMAWGAEESTDSEGWVVWWSRLDGRYQVEVTRVSNTNANSGRLNVYVGETGVLLHSEAIEISYGAPFGPDVSDVDMWRHRAMAAVDEHKQKDIRDESK